MLRLDIVPGLRPDDDWLNWHYEMRHKHHELMFSISNLQRDIDRMSELLTRVEDRTRRTSAE